jgi:hypothetical protein
MQTLEEIYNAIIAEKQSNAVLNGLLPTYNLAGITPDNPLYLLLQGISSQSKVSIWNLFLYYNAVGIFNQQQLNAIAKSEIEEAAKANEAGTLKWYADQVLKFQFGYNLIWNSNNYTYLYSDTVSQAAIDARIISKVSVTEVFVSNFNGVAVKVAKAVGGVLAPLDDTPGGELDTLKYYINRVKFAGINTSVLSLAADLIRLNLKVFYDGILDLNTIESAVEAAIKQYLNDILFDSWFITNKLIDALQLISGVLDVYVLNSEFKPASAGSFTPVLNRYKPEAGYFELVPVGTIGTDTQIEYEAE